MTKQSNKIKERILQQRGLTRTLGKSTSAGTIIPVNIPITRVRKSPLMKLMEAKYGRGRTIEEILLSGSLSEVRKLLNYEVDKTTLSKWIKRLKLRWTKDNLPDCQFCKHYKQDACDYGVCPFLMELGKYELALLKRKELLGG